MLVDRFGRQVTDVRLSLTDRCNFRCTYCMPAEGLPWLDRKDVLTAAEIERVARILAGFGVESFKLTGGEPTVRRDLLDIVGRLRAIGSHLDLSLTTNGYLLEGLAAPLADAGLDRVTISCDSLQRHRFAELTRRDALDAVLRGIEAADAAGLRPVKINCVVIGGTNADEVLSFAELARRTGHHVRFIEFMPLDADRSWAPDVVVDSDELRRTIDAAHPLVAESSIDGPATTFRFADGAGGSVGFIPSVTAPFCASCDRARLTADGQLRACLFSTDETDLRTPMRAGATDDDLGAAIAATVASKWAGHRIGEADFVRPTRSMSQIGG